jgi:hypothetical protein
VGAGLSLRDTAKKLGVGRSQVKRDVSPKGTNASPKGTASADERKALDKAAAAEDRPAAYVARRAILVEDEGLSEMSRITRKQMRRCSISNLDRRKKWTLRPQKCGPHL